MKPISYNFTKPPIDAASALFDIVIFAEFMLVGYADEWGLGNAETDEDFRAAAEKISLTAEEAAYLESVLHCTWATLQSAERHARQSDSESFVRAVAKLKDLHEKVYRAVRTWEELRQ